MEGRRRRMRGGQLPKVAYLIIQVWKPSAIAVELVALTIKAVCHLLRDPQQHCEQSRTHYPDTPEREPTVQRGEGTVWNNSKNDKARNKTRVSWRSIVHIYLHCLCYFLPFHLSKDQCSVIEGYFLSGDIADALALAPPS